MDYATPQHHLTVKEIALIFSDSSIDELPELIASFQSDSRAGVQKICSTSRKRLVKAEEQISHTQKLYETMRQIGGSGIIAGIDEVGRGPLAGPLTVAAVVLPDDPQILGLNDSKKLTPKRREELAVQIAEVADAIGISHVEAEEIDACGMAASLRVAMRRALADAEISPDAILIDGNPIHAFSAERCIINGDARVASIAAASIVAKVARDTLMVQYDKLFPGYHFASSKGYGSAEHIAAIKDKGMCPIHRRSFLKRIVSQF